MLRSVWHDFCKRTVRHYSQSAPGCVIDHVFSSSRSTSAPSATASSTSSGAGTVPPPPATTVSSVALTESFHSTNPTAVPLSSIYASASGQMTVTLDSTFAAGATGPVSGAPPLPTCEFCPYLPLASIRSFAHVCHPCSRIRLWSVSRIRCHPSD